LTPANYSVDRGEKIDHIAKRRANQQSHLL
jgi:hypothetical protein